MRRFHLSKNSELEFNKKGRVLSTTLQSEQQEKE